MKNILLVGEWNSPNLGDLVLCNCCYKYIEEKKLGCNLIKFDLSFGYTPGKIQHWLYAKFARLLDLYKIFVRKKDFNQTLPLSYLRSKIYIKQSINKLPKIDYIIFCGGQIFLDYFTYCVSEIVAYAETNKIPLIWNACGGSELISPSKEIFNKCINSPMTQSISVRDNIQYFKSVTPKAILVPDTAILVQESYPDVIEHNNVIGLGTISYNLIQERLNGSITKKEILLFWKDIISKIEKLGIEWLFFTNGDPEDYDAAKQILMQLGYDNWSTHICARPKSDKELIYLISKFEAIISFRLHSHIIAYSLGIPSYGLAWDKKIIDFFSLSGRTDFCSNLGNFNSKSVFEFIEFGRKATSSNILSDRVKKHLDNEIIKQIVNHDS